MNTSKAAEAKRKFLKSLASQPGLDLFEFLPDTQFWMKDRAGRFLSANAPFLKACGLSAEAELIGKTDLDVWPRHLAQAYRTDDLRVMETGRPIVNKLELSKNSRGGADWFCTTKVAVRGKSGAVLGTAGFARDVKKSHSSFKPYMEMSAVIEHILSNYASTLSLKALASMASMSLSQFERRFKRNFGSTPTQYIRSIRIQAACQYLAEGDLSISQIAFKTGHYDHSHFNRCFHAVMGQTATQYRGNHGRK